MKNTITRRLQREWAIKALYQLEITKDPLEKGWHSFLVLEPQAKDASYSYFLVREVLGKKVELDSMLEKHVKRWRMERLSRIDINILRLGLYEILYCADVPTPVAVDEAIELGKAFSGTEAAKFINGILGRFAEGSHK